jgi:hypothetical protein
MTSLGDAFCYVTVSLSTTGYGDIVPVTPEARLLTTVVITPLRLLFLIVLVGTTVELRTEHSRQAVRIATGGSSGSIRARRRSRGRVKAATNPRGSSRMSSPPTARWARGTSARAARSSRTSVIWS